MPIYEYECNGHGVFELERTLSESRLEGECPRCSTGCRRILSVPRLAALPQNTRIAHERNERSRHEPKLAVRGAGVHSPGSPHGQSHRHAASTGGAKRYAGPRPWVIEHG